MHTKIINPSDWDFGRPTAMMVKLSSRGLVGNDRSDFIKVASHVFLEALDNYKAAKDEVPVHLIALGADESYGGNRNGDSFDIDTCRSCHHTFEKYAKWYRDHKNKPDKGHPHYGFVKKSAYNEDMHRVELLVILNGEKSAADRNGGLIADKEIARLTRGDDIPVSMSCKIAFDVCSGCGNKAPTRDSYCRGIDQGGTCKYGGCKDNLTKVAEDGFVLTVQNPNSLFFDISNVFRPADRIAYGARAGWAENR